ncbi:putative sensor domain DACNV-containing protein [Planctomicrobium sp. SH668]|uniref:putative sensor domain DACNV-containing protein n=1 Tax=Planctomicrobium sp. SH668 TaxID=3448126 RepID=UPI003F5C879C
MDTSNFIYSSQLSDETRQRWKSTGNSPENLPEDRILRQLIDAAYQASLLREEGEQVSCRVIFATPEELTKLQQNELGPLVCLRFREMQALSAHQIRKLAFSAGFYRSLLGVLIDPVDDSLKIWGIINTGTRWVNRVSSGRPEDLPLPPNLVIQIHGPGHLVIASGDLRLFETSGGILRADGFDPFESRWLPERFRTVKLAMDAILESDGHDHETRICNEFMKCAAQSVVRRAIGLIRTRGHGGMLTYICEQEDAASVAHRWFRFRVFFEQDDGAKRFRLLLFRLVKSLIRVGKERGLNVVTWDDFQWLVDAEIQALDEALIEFSHLLADFMSVDGALVLDRSFRVIGFGAEILGDTHVSVIHRAVDLEATLTVAESADASGTRHRAAYRLVSGVPDVIALVVSQDGAVRFVANHNQKLTYWPYLP